MNLKIQITENYGLFKRLEGNRKVSESRINRIIRSIESVGYIPSPIIVNEKYEVIDGQGRLEALKRLGLPVYYIIIPNIGIEECISMNINQENWKIRDYIESYAEKGDLSYVNLLNLLNEFSEISIEVISGIAAGKVEKDTKAIKEGRFKCSMDGYMHAREELRFISFFVPIFKSIGGHVEFFYQAIGFCFNDEEVDNQKLIHKIKNCNFEFKKVTDIHGAFDQIERAYNFNYRGNKVYIAQHYREYMDGKYSWYASRYWKDKKEDNNND